MAEGMSDTQANWNADNAIEKLCARLNSTNYTLYLTGSNNFRYEVFPEYKLSRRNVPKPEHLQSVKEYLVKEYGAVLSDGCEADDLCGVDQIQSNLNGEETTLCSIDKDLNQIEGRHFSPSIWRNGEVIKEEQWYTISPIDALQFFYTQLLTGDATDGIPGARGIGKVKAARIMEGLTEELDMFDAVRDHYSCDAEMLMNGKLLYIWREMGGIWKPPRELDVHM